MLVYPDADVTSVPPGAPWNQPNGQTFSFSSISSGTVVRLTSGSLELARLVYWVNRIYWVIGHGPTCTDPRPMWPIQKSDRFDPLTPIDPFPALYRRKQLVFLQCRIRPEEVLYDAERDLLAIAKFLVENTCKMVYCGRRCEYCYDIVSCYRRKAGCCRGILLVTRAVSPWAGRVGVLLITGLKRCGI